jgi:TrmH family RNA methyltransferase
LITSARHPLIRRARALHRRQRRDASGLALAEGIKLVGDALAARAPLVEALVSARLFERPEGVDLERRLREADVPCHRVSDRVLAAAAATETHQGVLAFCRRQPVDLAHLAAPERAPLLVVALGVQEPGNVGALLRVAEALGASGLVACASADPWGPKAVRASAASVFRLPVATAASGAEALARLSGSGYRLVAAVARGGEPPERVSFAPPLALVLGSEGRGLAEPDLAACGSRVTVPLRAPVESLNVAAAAAVLLYVASGRRQPLAHPQRRGEG